MENQLVEGMTRTEVVALLGPPAEDVEGALGYGIGLRGSCEFLSLAFDHDGRLESWQRTQS